MNPPPLDGATPLRYTIRVLGGAMLMLLPRALAVLLPRLIA